MQCNQKKVFGSQWKYFSSQEYFGYCTSCRRVQEKTREYQASCTCVRSVQPEKDSGSISNSQQNCLNMTDQFVGRDTLNWKPASYFPWLYIMHYTWESPVGTGSGRSEISPYGAGARGCPWALSAPGWGMGAGDGAGPGPAGGVWLGPMWRDP